MTWVGGAVGGDHTLFRKCPREGRILVKNKGKVKLGIHVSEHITRLF